MENNKKKKITIISTIVLLVVIIAGAVIYMAAWKNKKEEITVSDPANIIDRVRALQLTGGRLEVSEGEINGTLKTLISKPVEKGGVTVNGAYADIKNDSMTIYAPVRYKGMDLLPNITGKLRYENDKLIFDIASLKVGKLSLPKSILMEQLRNFSNEDINITGNSIEISKYLLPFNAKNIYIENDKLIAEVDKLNILKETSSGVNDAGKTTAPGQSTTQNAGTKNTSNSSSSTPKQTAGTDKKTDTSVPQSAKEMQTNTLKKVSSQLSGVIADVSTPKEKQMMKKIQNVVSEVSKNPSYPYQTQANEVKAWYSTLDPEAKERVKKAILNNVNPMEILKLVNIFGV